MAVARPQLLLPIQHHYKIPELNKQSVSSKKFSLEKKDAKEIAREEEEKKFAAYFFDKTGCARWCGSTAECPPLTNLDLGIVVQRISQVKNTRVVKSFAKLKNGQILC